MNSSLTAAQGGVKTPRPPPGPAGSTPPGPRPEPRARHGPERGPTPPICTAPSGGTRGPAAPPGNGAAAAPLRGAGGPGPAGVQLPPLPPPPGSLRAGAGAPDQRPGLPQPAGLRSPGRHREARPARSSPRQVPVPAGNFTPRPRHRRRLLQLRRLPPVRPPPRHPDTPPERPEGSGSPCGSHPPAALTHRLPRHSPPPRNSRNLLPTPLLCHQPSPQKGSLFPCQQHPSNFGSSQCSCSSRSPYRQPRTGEEARCFLCPSPLSLCPPQLHHHRQKAPGGQPSTKATVRGTAAATRTSPHL